MQFHTPEQELKHLRRNAPEPSMTQLFDECRRKGVPILDWLDDLGSEEFIEKDYPKPAGYAAQTRGHLYDLTAPALLDSGATVPTIPEEVLRGTLSYFQEHPEAADL
eukprot:2854643-Alexandrium_andersonii.AAC.1